MCSKAIFRIGMSEREVEETDEWRSIHEDRLKSGEEELRKSQEQSERRFRETRDEFRWIHSQEEEKKQDKREEGEAQQLVDQPISVKINGRVEETQSRFFNREKSSVWFKQLLSGSLKQLSVFMSNSTWAIVHTWLQS